MAKRPRVRVQPSTFNLQPNNLQPSTKPPSTFNQTTFNLQPSTKQPSTKPPSTKPPSTKPPSTKPPNHHLVKLETQNPNSPLKYHVYNLLCHGWCINWHGSADK
ncbi:MAG: hypothetical protein F6J94_04150 [Moorea sp. SIO1F2]|uniref:hypothetical protein n=1 Tax=Moorena sp. SIO1F2 TaxID=2607819 RepID=UPI0013B869B0|nr:hypothetical protein [Moorena sp. SIO1F2]NET81172.1 hypothetical protein [Moorena sp. SIO1F2]